MARSAGFCAAVAVPSLSLGFAAGWLASKSQSVRHPPHQTSTEPLQPVLPALQMNAAASSQLLRSSRDEEAHSRSSRGEESQSQSSRDDEAHALLERVYPLHGEGAKWDALPLSRHRIILVTGPQRSGTTWAACALASQYGYVLYDERHPLTAGNDTLVSLQRAFAFAREQPTGSVIQSPMATSVLHELPLFPGLAIVFLARNCLDVFRSQNRVMPHRGGWTCVAGRTKELRKYRLRAELAPHFDGRDMLCTIKQNVWKRYQRPLLERRVATELTSAGAGGKPPLLATVEFDSFRTHPMWTGSEQRANLSIKRAAGGCAQLLRASTPLRSQRRVREWTALADAAMGRSASLSGSG